MNSRGAVLITVMVLLLASQAMPLSMAATSSIPSQAVGLALTIIPPKLPADNGTYPAVVVSLVDSNGLPSAALSSLTVFLTSSQTNIASVPSPITIPIGREYVVVNATTTPTHGSTTVTAQSHGLGTSYAQLTTVIPSGFPSKLKVFVSPSAFLRRADTGSVRVELVDGAGSPSKAITPVTVLLSSSNGTVASLNQNSLTINPGDIYATGNFTTSSNSGQAVITASSTGYEPDWSLIEVVPPDYCISSCGPSGLLLKPVSDALPADGRAYSGLEVGLATGSGQPAISSSDTIVQLSSSEPDVVSVPDLVTIPAGSISVLASLTTSSLPGRSIITAFSFSSSLLPDNLSVTTLIPAPSVLQAYMAPPSTFVSSAGNSPILVIQLQDSNGNPARARVATDITVTSTDSSMVSGPLHLSVEKGLDYTSTHLTVSGSGQSVLTASSQGLSSSHVNLQLAMSPLVDQLSASASAIYYNGTATMTLSVTFLGQPVKNLTVYWNATRGAVSPTPTKTGPAGTASSTFTPHATGVANITASASSPQTGPIFRSFLILVSQAPTLPAPTLLHRILGYWYLIAAAVVAALIAAFYLLRMRRKKHRAEIEAGFEVI